MDDTIVIGVACGLAGLIVFILLIVICMRKRRGNDYEPIPEKGLVISYVDPSIEQKKTQENALMTARFYLRSARYTLEKNLSDIGSRESKFYYLVKSQQANDGKERIMSMLPKAPSWPIVLDSETGRQTFIKLIKSLEDHPFIASPVVVDYIMEKHTAVAIRNFYPKGSLKDFIHKAKPLKPYAEKYKTVYELNEKLIARFGRQILEALAFLKYQGIPYYHLHSGNILLDDNVCYLSDIENMFMGVPPNLISFMRPLIQKVEPEVVAFGCVLFEMGNGYELESVEAYAMEISPECPERVKKVLESIFQPWYGAPPSVDDLLQMDLFSDVKIKKPSYQRNQYSAKERDMIASIKKATIAIITSSPINPSEFKQSKKSPRKVTPFESSAITVPTSPYGDIAASPRTSSLASSLPRPQPSPAPAPAAKPAAAAAAPPPPPPSAKGAPPPPPPAGKPPPPPPPAGPPPAAPAGKKALLSSIEGFSSGSLKKTVTKDRSGPKLR